MDESSSLWAIDGTVDMLLPLEEEEESSLLLSSLLLYSANPDPSAGERAPSTPLFIKAQYNNASAAPAVNDMMGAPTTKQQQ